MCSLREGAGVVAADTPGLGSWDTPPWMVGVSVPGMALPDCLEHARNVHLCHRYHGMISQFYLSHQEVNSISFRTKVFIQKMAGGKMFDKVR